MSDTGMDGVIEGGIVGEFGGIGEPRAIPQADGGDTAIPPADIVTLVSRYWSSPENTPGTALHALLADLNALRASL